MRMQVSFFLALFHPGHEYWKSLPRTQTVTLRLVFYIRIINGRCCNRHLNDNMKGQSFYRWILLEWFMGEIFINCSMHVGRDLIENIQINFWCCATVIRVSPNEARRGTTFFISIHLKLRITVQIERSKTDTKMNPHPNSDTLSIVQKVDSFSRNSIKTINTFNTKLFWCISVSANTSTSMLRNMSDFKCWRRQISNTELTMYKVNTNLFPGEISNIRMWKNII